MDFVLEDYDLTRKNLAAGGILSKKVVQAVGVIACIGLQTTKSLLLNDQRVELGFVVLHGLLIVGHRLSSLPDALSLQRCLLVHLTNLHKNHTCRKEVELLVEQQTEEEL